MHLDTSVLIVGGGLNGLTMALLLARRDVRCIVIERHPRTSIQYKFSGISPRSMEIFREAGAEDDVRAHRTGDQQAGGVARGRTLADPEIQWMMDSAWPDVSGLGATGPATCDQHVLEPILRTHAEQCGADVRFGTELLALTQKADHVEARVRSVASGTDHTLRAAYVVAADGANGTVRDRLDIGRTGPGVLQHWMNLLFDTDLEPVLQGRRFTSCFVSALNATFTPRESGPWVLALQYDPEHGDRPEAFDAARCLRLVREGAGRDTVRADLVDARAWSVAGWISDAFRRDRVFLLGDAAHVMPPTGAFGGNTGIHDAHNLAWKLELVLKGQADRTLLDTYETERRPVAAHSLAQALARLQAWFADPQGRLPAPVPQVAEYDVVFGQRYEEGALLSEPGEQGQPPFATAHALSGRPGTRAPHMVLTRDGADVPVHDLFGAGFVLLTGAGGRPWAEAVRKLSRRSGPPLTCQTIGTGCALGDSGRQWPARYGVRDAGAVLVRPDGFVAWRTPDATAAAESMLTNVLRRLHLRA
ncbi:MAG: FAD-dependent monooxygenase [Vicinamibacterales bacterium]